MKTKLQSARKGAAQGLASSLSLIGVVVLIGSILLTGSEAAATTETARWFGLGNTIFAGTPLGPEKRVLPIGSKAARTTVEWGQVEPQKGNYRFNELRDMLENARENDVDVLLVPAYSPRWAADQGCLDTANRQAFKNVDQSNPSEVAAAEARERDLSAHCEPRDVNEYATMVGKFAEYVVANNFPVTEWELWNEPNTKHFWKDVNHKPNPEKYAELVKASYTKIRAAYPNPDDVTIVIGSTANSGTYVPGGDSNTIDPRLFLEQLYDNGVKGYFDAFSHHPYTWAGNPDKKVADDDGWQLMHVDLEETYNDGPNTVTVTQPSLRSILQANGDGDKRIWNTEWGLPSVEMETRSGFLTKHTEQTQSSQFDQALNLWKGYIEDGWAGKFYGFRWQDKKDYVNYPIPQQEHADYMGINRKSGGNPGCDSSYNPTGSAKIAYCTIKEFLDTNPTLAVNETPTVDTTKPTVAINSPTDGATVTSETITFSASASDETALERVIMYIDGNVVNNDTSAPFETTIDTSVLSDGSHNFGAKAVDTAGNTRFVRHVITKSTSATGSVTVTSHETDAVLHGLSTLTAATNDASAVDFFVDQTLIGTDSSEPFSIEWDSSLVTDGRHTISARINVGGTFVTDSVDIYTSNRTDSEITIEPQKTKSQVNADGELVVYDTSTPELKFRSNEALSNVEATINGTPTTLNNGAVVISGPNGDYEVIIRGRRGDEVLEQRVRVKLRSTDIDRSGTVGLNDLLLIINKWQTADAELDLDDSGQVGLSDMLLVIDNWER